MLARAAKLGVLAVLLLVVANFGRPQATDTLLGRLTIDHPGFENHKFVESYVYVFEQNKYYKVAEDGTFAIEALPDGTYAFKSYAPGFEPSYRTIGFPEQRELVMPIKLQTIEMASVVVEQEVPAYLEGVRDLLGSSPEVHEPAADQIETAPPPETVPSTSPGDTKGPTINLKRVFQSLFRRNRDKEE